MRAEADKGTPLTTLYRNRDMITGLVGGKCKLRHAAVSAQPLCVNPNCNALDSQDAHAIVGLAAESDVLHRRRAHLLADPPAYYGMIEFDAGGRMMADFTDMRQGPGRGRHRCA